MRRTFRTALLPLALLAVPIAGCHHTPKNGAAARQQDEQITVRVENQNFADMTIYVIQSGQRVRLGLANGNSTARFKIPRSMIFGLSQLQFQAHPIGGRGDPISETITVSPGDTIRLVIPPH
jgi:hypothetical protein